MKQFVSRKLELTRMYRLLPFKSSLWQTTTVHPQCLKIHQLLKRSTGKKLDLLLVHRSKRKHLIISKKTLSLITILLIVNLILWILLIVFQIGSFLLLHLPNRALSLSQFLLLETNQNRWKRQNLFKILWRSKKSWQEKREKTKKGHWVKIE